MRAKLNVNPAGRATYGNILDTHHKTCSWAPCTILMLGSVGEGVPCHSACIAARAGIDTVCAYPLVGTFWHRTKCILNNSHLTKHVVYACLLVQSNKIVARKVELQQAAHPTY